MRFAVCVYSGILLLRTAYCVLRYLQRRHLAGVIQSRSWYLTVVGSAHGVLADQK